MNKKMSTLFGLNVGRASAVLTLGATLGATLFSGSAEATPAFARQMEMGCLSCHSQALTTLNSFGRAFKLSGYSMASGNKSMITGSTLRTSIPLALNAGIGLKANYVSSDDPAIRDNLSFPAGSSIFFGGKIAENAGVNTLWNGDGLIHLQATFAQPVGAGRAGVSVYGSQGHGPFISTESYNTGLHKELAIFENSQRTNAAQATGVGSGPASGLTAFYGGHGLTLTAGAWTKGYNSIYSNKGLDTDGIDQTLFRLTYDLPTMAAWDVMVGAFGLNGSTTGTPCKLWENTAAPFATCTGTPWASLLTKFDTSASGFDMQAQGSIAGMDTQIVLNHVANWEYKITNADPKTLTATPPAQPTPLGAVRMNQESKATSIEARMMFTPNFGASIGHLSFDNKLNANGDYKTMSLGLIYNYSDNVRLSLERSSINNKTVADVDETTVQLLLGF